MKLLIFTEGSTNIGFGHLTRCIALYQQFEQIGYTPKLIIYGDKSIQSLIANLHYTVVNWFDASALENYLSKQIDIAIIDSYLADKNTYGKIVHSAKLTVYIDDNNRIRYPKGIVVNGNMYANLLNYNKEHEQIFLLGSPYTILRDKFLNTPKKNVRKEIKHILITFGGDDIRNMTPKVLSALNTQYPDIKKTAIIGAGFRHAKQLLRYQGNNTQCVFSPNVSEIKKLMINADIAISGGGQTLYELARTGTPTLVITIAGNQIHNIKELTKQGITIYTGIWHDKNIGEKIIDSISFLNSQEKRKKISTLAQQCIDGKGAKRVATEIVSYYISRSKIS